MEEIIRKKLAEVPEDEMKQLNKILSDAMEELIYRSVQIWVTGKDAAILSCIIDQKHPELTYEFRDAHHKLHWYEGGNGKYTLQSSVCGSEWNEVTIVGDQLHKQDYHWVTTSEYIRQNKIAHKNLTYSETLKIVHKKTDICKHCVSVVMTIRYPKAKPKAFY